MIGTMTQFQSRVKEVEEAAEKAAFRNLGHAAASIRKDAVKSITRSKEPSPEGGPIHTRKGQAKRAVRYAVDFEKEEALIGFQESKVGTAMAAHERGETYKDVDFPERPTMGPALERGAPRFAKDWAASIGE